MHRNTCCFGTPGLGTFRWTKNKVLTKICVCITLQLIWQNNKTSSSDFRFWSKTCWKTPKRHFDVAVTGWGPILWRYSCTTYDGVTRSVVTLHSEINQLVKLKIESMFTAWLVMWVWSKVAPWFKSIQTILKDTSLIFPFKKDVARKERRSCSRHVLLGCCWSFNGFSWVSYSQHADVKVPLWYCIRMSAPWFIFT